MSENLFIPLFVFSGWFLLKSYSNGGKPWDLLAGLSIFYLYLTRSMGIAMIIGLLISFLFYMLVSSKKEKISEILKISIYLLFRLWHLLSYGHIISRFCPGDR